MGAESALLGSLITTAGGLLMQLIAKIKCVYRHTEDGCQPACACMDGKLEKTTTSSRFIPCLLTESILSTWLRKNKLYR